jgi:hypothetical protein
MTTVKYLYGRRVKVVVETSTGSTTFENKQTPKNSWAIQFNIPFSDSSTPPTCTVTIKNLSAKNRSLFKVGRTVKVYAGYAEDGTGLISSGAIRSTTPYTSDGVNTTFTFTYREGDEYANAESSAEKANDKLEAARKKQEKAIGKKAAAKLPKIKKHSALSFGKNSKAETIIRRIAKDAGIKISGIYLKKNNTYRKGFTCHGKPLSNIQTIAKACGSQVYYRRGQVYIDDLSKKLGHQETVLITDHVKGNGGGTGLIQYPTTSSETNEAKHKTWEVVSLLRYQISTGSVVTVRNKFLNGTFRVKSGTHVCDDSAFTTTMEVYV